MCLLSAHLCCGSPEFDGEAQAKPVDQDLGTLKKGENVSRRQLLYCIPSLYLKTVYIQCNFERGRFGRGSIKAVCASQYFAIVFITGLINNKKYYGSIFYIYVTEKQHIVDSLF